MAAKSILPACLTVIHVCLCGISYSASLADSVGCKSSQSESIQLSSLAAICGSLCKRCSLYKLCARFLNGFLGRAVAFGSAQEPLLPMQCISANQHNELSLCHAAFATGALFRATRGPRAAAIAGLVGAAAGAALVGARETLAKGL